MGNKQEDIPTLAEYRLGRYAGRLASDRADEDLALWRPFVYARTALLRADFDWLRNRAGGRLNSRLKARLNEASDS